MLWKFFSIDTLFLISIFHYNMLQIWFILFSETIWHSPSLWHSFRHLTSLFNIFNVCAWCKPWSKPFCISWSVMLQVEIRLRVPMDSFNTFMGSSLQRYEQILLFCYEVQYVFLDYRIREQVTKFLIGTRLSWANSQLMIWRLLP